jgi:hypothetical protein
VRAHSHDVAGVELTAASLLALSVDPHRLAREQLLDLGSAVQHPGQLQQLSEPDHLTSDRDLAGHGDGSSSCSITFSILPLEKPGSITHFLEQQP